MSELLQTVMDGARKVMKTQAVNANNLANASTVGFRAELAHISGEQGDGNDVKSSPDFSKGAIRTTARSLDISVNGEGWIAIMTPEGAEGYSRRGDLHVDSFGQMTNGAGHPVLGNSGPISLPPYSSIEIASDGTISIQPMGQTPNTIAAVDRIKLVLPDEATLQRGDDGIIRNRDNFEAEADASVSIQSGALEGSNVNPVAEMLTMIDLARQFEAQVKLMKSADENASRLASVMRLS